MVCKLELVLWRAPLDLLGRSEQPATVLRTLKALAGTIDWIDHQQITPFREQLFTTPGQQVLFGTSQSSETQHELTFGAPARQLPEQIRDQLPATLHRLQELIFGHLGINAPLGLNTSKIRNSRTHQHGISGGL